MVVKKIPIDLIDKQIKILEKGGSCFIKAEQYGKGIKIPMKKTDYNKMMRNFSQGKKYKLKGEKCGEGFWSTIKKFLFREPGVLPPYSRKLLEKIGNEKITSLKVVRVPLENTALINALTLNQYYKAVRNKGYDKMFHLSIEINGKYTLEKTAVPQITKKLQSTKKDAESMNVPLKKDITINELIEKTIKYMGKEEFSSYNVTTNNCQRFIKSILQSNHLLNKNLLHFIEQDVESIYKHLPKYAKVITDFATKLGAVTDKIVYGAGIDFNNLSIKGVEYRFSSTEHSYLKDVYIATGTYQGYDVIQIFMYYPDNFNTAITKDILKLTLLGKLIDTTDIDLRLPKSLGGGYHQHDVEYLQIYFKDNKPVKYVYSCHASSETNVYTSVQISDSYIVDYVARDSHANYDTKGVKTRLGGLANDVCDDDGKKIRMSFSQMKKITNNISYEGIGTVISNTIIPPP